MERIVQSTYLHITYEKDKHKIENTFDGFSPLKTKLAKTTGSRKTRAK